MSGRGFVQLRRRRTQQNFTRRMFLTTSALSGAAFALCPNRWTANFQTVPATKPQKVIVVGAGIAGLVAAFELMQSGHDVRVFEARLRPGGRIHTIRDEFSDGLYVEAGAYDFADSYTLLHHYIELFSLPVEEGGAPEKSAAANDLFYLRGKRFVAAPGTPPDWPYVLSAEERGLGMQGLWEKYIGGDGDSIKNPSSGGWPDAAARELDSVTVNQLLKKRGASDEVISLFRMSFLGEDFEYVSALQDIIWQSFLGRAKTWAKLRGGNDQLPKAFAQRLGTRMHYGVVLRKVSQDREKVTLSVSKAGVLEQAEADRVIIAIPFSVLRTVELDGSFSPRKRMVISKLRYAPITRIYLQSSTRFWQGENLSGYASTDLPIRTILNFTDTQPGTRAIIGTETSGPNARIAGAMKPEERVHWGLTNVGKVFPEIMANFDGGMSISWEKEPWSLGASAYFAPGEMTTMFPDVATIEGRVHFAGEHTSTLFVMEGAAQSGFRAANEVLGAHEVA